MEDHRSLDEAVEEYLPEFMALRDRSEIEIHLGHVEAWQLMSIIQLAMRHPALSDDSPARATAMEFARGLQERVATTPALAELAEMGWNPECDQ